MTDSNAAAHPGEHPNDAELRRWVVGDLDEASSVRVHDHVSRCPACESKLHTIEQESASFFTILRSGIDATSRGDTLSLDEKQAMDETSAALSVSRPPAQDATPVRSGRLSRNSSLYPGAEISGRYRIASLLGRGGMGEVYKAEDLRLGQTVALKFLSGRFATNERTRRYFLDEVRLSQRLSHPHICRVHDLVDDGEQLFLSMEYIEGEDLSSLLKRLGPLPTAKATELAGQLCQGLAAAHDAGVLHRDLKPANIMIDQRGRARITDFGLAKEHDSISEGEGVVGTPRYMAPEQLRYNQTSVQSDIYSLGLILYEIFAGKQAHASTSLQGLSDLHDANAAGMAILQTVELDREITEPIASCLANDPKKRPITVAALANALPGRSALDVAVATGATLSPELLAISGPKGSLKPRTVVGCLALVTGLLLLMSWLSSRSLASMGSLLPPFEIKQRASQVLDRLQIQRGMYTAVGHEFDRGLLQWHAKAKLLTKPDPVSEPETVYGWYRESRVGIAPLRPDWSGDVFLQVDEYRPPLQPGSSRLRFRGDGGVQLLIHHPPFRAAESNPAAERVAVDWNAMLSVTGLRPNEIADLEPIEPHFVAQTPSDRRRSWRLQGRSGLEPELRIDAAALGQTPTYLRVVGPWTKPENERWTGTLRQNGLITQLMVAVILGLFAGSAYLARRNVFAQTADQVGARRVAAFAGGVCFLIWLVGGAHVDNSLEIDLLLTAIAGAAMFGGLVWTNYLALEPIVRREYPITLVSFCRLLEGKFRDQLIGRHLLLGILAGIMAATFKMVIVHPSSLSFIPSVNVPNITTLLPLAGGRHLFGEVIRSAGLAVFYGVYGQLMMLILFRFVLRDMRLAVLAFVTFSSFRVAIQFDEFWLTLVLTGIEMSVTAFLLLRVGLLAVLAMHFTRLMLKWPMTWDTADWWFGHSMFALGVIGVLTLCAAWVATGRRGRSDPSPERAT
ncbi:MAG: protein kinase [Planctomycetota bacterium]